MTEIEQAIVEINQNIIKIEAQQHEFKASILEHWKYTLGNLHIHIKNQSDDIRKTLLCLKESIDRIEKESLTQKQAEKIYVKQSDCTLTHMKSQAEYVTRTQLWKWLVLMMVGISGLWAVMTVLWPLLKLMMMK